MKRKLFGILAGIVITIILFASAAGYYLLRGMQEMNAMVIHEVDLEQVEDGTYIGVFEEGYRWSCKVSVTLYNHKFIGINIIEKQTFHKDEVSDELFERIYNEQKINVDTVSGATITSKGYMKAIENALK